MVHAKRFVSMPGVISEFHFLSYYNRQMWELIVYTYITLVGLPYITNYQSSIIKATTLTIPIAV